MRTDGSDRERTLAHVGQFLALPQIERDGNDLRAVLLGQPPDRHRRVEATRICQDDTFHLVSSRNLAEPCRTP